MTSKPQAKARAKRRVAKNTKVGVPKKAVPKKAASKKAATEKAATKKAVAAKPTPKIATATKTVAKKPTAKAATEARVGANGQGKLEPKITPALVAAHGLKPDEYDRLCQLIGRTPTFTELGIFSAMWNEHCSYK